MAGKRRIAILGGGVGGMATAFELTNWDGWQDAYEIDVYQMGWRLGGKGASGRRPDLADRIEEHGLHVWMGFYENAFHLIRQAYDDCARRGLTPNSPFKTWQDAFTRQDYAANMDKTSSGWSPWTIHFPPNDTLPGEQALFDRKEGPPSLWDLFVIALEWIFRRLEELEGLAGPHEPPRHLSDLFARLAVDVEQRASALLRALIARIIVPAEFVAGHLLSALIGLLQHIADAVLDPIASRLEQEPELRHLFYLVDAGSAMARGFLADDVLGRGLAAIDDVDLIEWLTKHGCRNPKNPFVIAGYDALFAYNQGDPAQPNISAGVSLYGVLRMMFTYRGSMFWRMNAGMGDTIFAPLYLLLRARGVRFHFFHRVTRVTPGAAAVEAGAADSIDAIDFDLQATVKDEAKEYEPLYEVGGIPCWPAAPFYEQLVEGPALQRGVNLESDYTTWRAVGTKTLRRGVDFDDVVLAIPPGASRWICADVAAAKPTWANMFANVKTVQTQAMQLWLTRSSADLGFPQPGEGQKPAVTAYIEPHDTWADMSHLIDRETWTAADNVQSIAYFCNAFQDAASIPAPFTAPDFPASQLARVREMALAFLNAGGIQVLWPHAGQPFDWTLCVQRDGAIGEATIDTQYLRANIDGTERYVLSLAGATGARLDPGSSGFSNLYLAGDWTANVVNAGCVEAGVISGRLASRAICGKPEHIYGAYGGPAQATQATLAAKA
ncbi:MAG TPA: NAD(P)-binding protein [Vicinamibacterales bacterium]|nr:NAD(P)-binding protein [Vicinamibacterales bacterium]